MIGFDSVDSALDAWCGWQKAEGLSERTITERALTLRRLFAQSGSLPLTLTPLNIMTFVGGAGLSTTTRWTYHQTIRAYCKWLVRAELRADDPSLKTPTPKRPRGKPQPITQGQFAHLLAAANRRRTRTYILLATLAGLRVHEIAKVRGEDFDLDARTLTVTGKGGKTETIPLHATLVEDAHRYPRRGYWFPSYKADHPDLPHVGRQAVSKAIRDAMTRAGFTGHAHQLRHWYGSNLLANGVDIRVVQQLMRHDSIQSTQIYTLVSGQQERDGIDRLNVPKPAQEHTVPENRAALMVRRSERALGLAIREGQARGEIGSRKNGVFYGNQHESGHRPR